MRKEQDEELGEAPVQLKMDEGSAIGMTGGREPGIESAGRRPSRSEYDDCLASRYLSKQHLLTELSDPIVSTRLTRLALNAKTSIDEQGVNVLYLAFGLLRWYESIHSDTPLLAPILLVPVQLGRARPDAPWKLSLYEEEVYPNHCLREMLRASFQLDLPDTPDEGLENRRAYMQTLAETVCAAKTQSRWEILDKVILGTFSYQKLAMWQDLGDNADRVVAHHLCRAIAGDQTASVSSSIAPLEPSTFDDAVQPKDLHTILDADNSQLKAILTVSGGANLVLDGPPGTGKSQTIANIIAEFLANGKTVLFVSEKAAALEVVKRRLDSQNLGDFCLDCHSHKANKRQVIEEFRRCLDLQAETSPDQTEKLDQLSSLRRRLNDYVSAIHLPQGALKISVYETHGRVAMLRQLRSSRCRIPRVLDFDNGTLQEVVDALHRLVACREIIGTSGGHPWRGCRVAGYSLAIQDEIRADFENLVEDIDDLRPTMTLLFRCGLLPQNATAPDLQTAVSHTQQLLQTPELPASWFDGDPGRIASAVKKLTSVLVRLKKTRTSLAAFRPEALDKDHQALTKRFDVHSHPWLARLRRAAPPSLRKRRDYLSRIVDDLSRLRKFVDDIGRSIDECSRAVSAPIPQDWSLEVIERLGILGCSVSEAGVLKASWFDVEKRSELRQVVAECQEQLSLANSLRERLSKVMSPSAFEAEGAEIADRAGESKSVLGRLLSKITGDWRRFRRQAEALYQSQPPNSDHTLLRDLRDLRQYHAHASILRQREARHAADIIHDDCGQPRWETITAGINAIEELQALIRIPRRMMQSLTTDGHLNQWTFDTATSKLLEQLVCLKSEVMTIDRRFLVSRTVEKKRNYTQLSVSAYSDWLRDIEGALREGVAEIDAVTTLLNEDADITFAALPDFFIKLNEILTLRNRVAALRAELAGIVPVPDDDDPTALAPYTELAEQVLKTLKTCGDTLTPPLIEALTKQEARRALSVACKQAASLFLGDPHSCWDTLTGCFKTSESVSTGVLIDNTPLCELAGWLRERSADAHLLDEWIRYRDIEEILRQNNVLPILHEVLRGKVELECAADAFLARFYRVWLDAVYKRDERLRHFLVEEHEQLIAEFRRLDRESLQSAHKRIRSRLLLDPERWHGSMLNAPAGSELGVLRREVKKKKRHLSLRKLFEKTPSVFKRLKPCVMMSPLAVSTYLGSSQITFDLVIFDEASQVRPFDAIGAVFRGQQLLVAGDQNQLPPTSFFDRLGIEDSDCTEGEEEQDLVRLDDFESILDVCCTVQIQRTRLQWHYRSRREPLIAFSNEHFYGNELITFPSVDDADAQTAVRFHFVSNGRWCHRREGGYNPIEARETAKLVLEHFDQHPDRSLGVITFNQTQQHEVLSELDRLRLQRQEMEEFFRETRDEPFFVKNLENVQGDERDHIILGVGYAFDAEGKFAMRFGPLNLQGGERRLNVAVTRARQHVIVISSVHATDIDLRRAQSVGARRLRAYLEYAEGGFRSVRNKVVDGSRRDSEFAFEAAVERELRSQGFDIRGRGGGRDSSPDLMLVDPNDPGRYVLGIDCDGENYRRWPTARDRDRLRPQVLEALGWRICRVWSTDWVRDPSRQIERIRVALRDALSGATEPATLSAGGTSPPPESLDEEQIPPSETIRNGVEDRKLSFRDIDDVPEATLKGAILDALRQYGRTTEQGLIREVRKVLGFARVTQRIRERVSAELHDLIDTGEIRSNDDDRLSLSK